ncbi:MAG: hypothetical protein K9K38_06095 [Rhodoferax sp.]|nr:hypothetical protein [Rhodoferax sp.]MCF8208961.1 hypothetical protein [Rhodoferax sp.]
MDGNTALAKQLSLSSEKNDASFGEGNFRTLFESMERDQVRQGVIQSAGD